MKQIRFTKEGYAALKLEYDDLLAQRRPAVEDLRKAREMGDLSENGYYKAARSKLSFLDGKIRRVKASLKQAVIIDKTQKQTIGIGSRVTITDGKHENTYHIVGDLEANPSMRAISLHSPLGSALEGKLPGNTVLVVTPKQTIPYTIITVA